MSCQDYPLKEQSCSGEYMLGLYHSYHCAKYREQMESLRPPFPFEMRGEDEPEEKSCKKSVVCSSGDIWAEIEAIWQSPTHDGLFAFAERYRLDRLDIEILACIISTQLTGGVKMLVGSEVVEKVDRLSNPLAILDRFTEGSALREQSLIYHHGPPWEGVLSLEWRVPDLVMLEMIGRAEAEGKYPAGCNGKKCDATDLAELREPRFNLDSVIIAPEKHEQIMALIAQNRRSTTLFEEWGLESQVKYGRAATILLYGSPGTGKSMLAEAIAREAKVGLVVARYSGLEAALVGETEKNIARLFNLAESTGRALLIDECDAILCRRLEGNRSNDRFYNQQLLMFCQEIERFNGLLILTTNRAEALDEAIDRRIALKIEMPKPNVAEREAIWRLHLTVRMPIAEDVRITELAHKFPLSGGQIKNVVVSAARTAIARAESKEVAPVVSMADLKSAANDEICTFRKNSNGSLIGFHSSKYEREMRSA